MELDYKEIGKRVKIARIRADLTQEAKATLRTFLGRRSNFTLDSSACCLKNSMIIIPQTCGVVKYFFQFPTKFFCHSAERQKNIRNLN